MAWSWSHTREAYVYAEKQVQEQPREWLEVAYAEWRANQVKGGAQAEGEAFCNRRYERALAYAKLPETTDEELANHIWDRMEAQATCSNGGWDAYCCPYGCHTVPFGPPDKDEEDEE